MKLIGIAGLAGSGKDTVADYLWERHGFTKIAFADPLRRAASAIFGLDAGVFLDRNRKDAVLDYWGMSPRQMLQFLGNEAVKPVFGADLWLKRWCLAYHMVRDSDHVVVPDVRFGLEAEALRKFGGTIVKIERAGAGALSGAGHVSEAGLAPQFIDAVIQNDGSLEDLYAKVEALL